MMLKIFLLTFLVSTNIIVGQSYDFMTFNIRYDTENDGVNQWSNRKQDLVGFIEHVNPTIFGVQEALNHQTRFIDNGLPAYAYVGVGRDDGLKKGEYCAIFYNKEQVRLINSGTFWLSETPESISVGWDAAMERICTYGLFEDSSTRNEFWVFNAHFDHKGSIARQHSAELIVNKIKLINSDDLPVILMGDFNATPDQSPIVTFKDNLSDGLVISKKPLEGPNGTFNGFRDKTGNRRIDYIFTSGFDVQSYVHMINKTKNGLFLSDHLPVYIKSVIQ